MPVRSGTGPGGSRASGPLSRWMGTSGNKVGVGSLLRPRRTFLRSGKFSEAVGIEVAVAITRLGKHAGSISLFLRFVKNYFRLLFALSSVFHTETRTGDACDRARQTAAPWPRTEGYTRYS